MPRCANPLFLRWVKEFHAEKDYRIKGGPPRPTGYENAIRALQECTEKYQHPVELKKLNGIGPTCISRLTEKLEKYCANRRIPMPEPPAPKRRAPAKPKLTAAQKRAALKAEEAKFVDEDSESEEASTSTASRKRSAPKRKKADESDDDDEYVERPKKHRVARRKVAKDEEDSD
ncbi:hypothetical protein FB107DRAFT_293823 [Schizophyllum commune]